MSLAPVLHILSGNLLRSSNDLGSTKDIKGRWLFFEKNNISFTSIYVSNRSDAILENFFKFSDLGDVDYIFYEHNRYPSSMNYIRRKYPNITQITRPHNAEFYHCMQTAFAFLKLSNTSLKWRLKYFRRYSTLAVDRLIKDIRCSINADYVGIINETEYNRYWKFIAPFTKVINMPYFTGKNYIKSQKNDNNLYIVGSTNFNALAWCNVIDTISFFGSQLNKKVNSVCVTGDLFNPKFSKVFKKYKSIKYLGIVENLDSILNSAKILLHPSSLGMGLKTKIHDFICAGGMVATTSQLKKKLPEIYHKRLILLEKNTMLLDLNSKFIDSGSENLEIDSHMKEIAFSSLALIFHDYKKNGLKYRNFIEL